MEMIATDISIYVYFHQCIDNVFFYSDNQNMTTLYYIHYIIERKIFEEVVLFILKIINLT